MKAGKIASLFLASVLGAVSAAICAFVLHVPELHASLHLNSPALESILLFVILFGTYALFLFPLGVSIDRSLSRLRQHLESTPEDRIGEKSLGEGPRWMRPVIGAFAAALDRFNDDQRELRNELRNSETKKHLAEAQKKQREAVLHTLRDAVIVTDDRDQIVMINEAASRIFGLDLKQVARRPVEEVLTDIKLCRLIRDTRQLGRIGEARHGEVKITPDNAADTLQESCEGTYDVCLVCIEEKTGEVGGVVAILHDLTRERELAQLKTDFVSKASHELRTPLSSIRAYIEMLIDGEAETEQSRQDFYRIIQDEADRLSRLIDNLLNISRIEAGIIQLELHEHRLTLLIERAIRAMEPHAREKNITLEMKLDADDLVVECDRDMVYQVILNLLSNAVKYTPADGRIMITATEDELTRSIVVSVIDSGLGIPPDAQSKIFEKFYRVNNYKQLAKGTGLGLTLCKHIVETLHHGHIDVESKLGMGSKFWFSLPIRQQGSRSAA